MFDRDYLEEVDESHGILSQEEGDIDEEHPEDPTLDDEDGFYSLEDDDPYYDNETDFWNDSGLLGASWGRAPVT